MSMTAGMPTARMSCHLLDKPKQIDCIYTIFIRNKCITCAYITISINSTSIGHLYSTHNQV